MESAARIKRRLTSCQLETGKKSPPSSKLTLHHESSSGSWSFNKVTSSICCSRQADRKSEYLCCSHVSRHWRQDNLTDVLVLRADFGRRADRLPQYLVDLLNNFSKKDILIPDKRSSLTLANGRVVMATLTFRAKSIHTVMRFWLNHQKYLNYHRWWWQTRQLWQLMARTHTCTHACTHTKLSSLFATILNLSTAAAAAAAGIS